MDSIATVDDQRLFRAKPTRRSRGVNRRVAAPVDNDAAAEARGIAGLDLMQQCDGVDDASGIARRYLDPLADLRADRDENRIESALLLLGE